MQTERQTQIMEMALELITEKGIQGLTIKNLSKKIGISEPAIYRHFESKNDILLTILDGFKEMGGMFAGMMDNFEGTAIDKIQFMFTKMIGLFIEKPSLVGVIFSEEIFINEESLKHSVIEIQNINQSTVENIIKKGKENNDVRQDVDSKNLALIIMGSLRLLVKNWSLNSYNFDLEKEGEILIESLNKIISP
jgi:AcrR family transcriptional regulator